MQKMSLFECTQGHRLKKQELAPPVLAVLSPGTLRKNVV
jgi:hypothetical protein